MTINNISIVNVKSFNKEVNIDFRKDFNVLIGPNGGGKSNLLDIITTVIRHYFLIPYHKGDDSNDLKKYISKKITYQNINTLLPKYYKNSKNSTIKISFILAESDIRQMTAIKEHYNDLLTLANLYSDRYNFRKELTPIDKWVLDGLNVGDVLSYTIINNELQPSKAIEEYFLSYLNIYQLVTLLTENQTLKLSTNFIFFAPFRTMNFEDFLVSLANYNVYDELASIRSKTSKSSFSLMKIITGYFGEKRRYYETKAKNKGFQTLWKQDVDVKIVEKLLVKFGYRWEMRLVEPNNNTYEICLIEGNIRKNFADTSSGEKEIINFILGILALGMRDGMIIIDEAELHLHPKWQITLIETFRELSKERNIQFIITTHSASFINQDTLKSVIRIYRNNYGASNVAIVKQNELLDNKLSIKKLLHIVTATNNEKMFFSDVVVLVEGITDKLVFQRILEEQLVERNIHKSIEILEIKGKSNRDMFQRFLYKFNVPYFFIGDLDCVNELSPSIKSKFKVNKNKIFLKDELSDEKIKEIDFVDLSDEDKNLFEEFFQKQNSLNNFILKHGTIEDYFPDQFKRKDITVVLDLLEGDNYAAWKTYDRYSNLVSIINKILTTVMA